MAHIPPDPIAADDVQWPIIPADTKPYPAYHTNTIYINTTIPADGRIIPSVLMCTYIHSVALCALQDGQLLTMDWLDLGRIGIGTPGRHVRAHSTLAALHIFVILHIKAMWQINSIVSPHVGLM